MAEMRSRQAEYDNRIDQLLTTIARLSQLTQPSEATNTPKPHPVPTSARARPATPPEFDGDRKKGMAFLNSCQTYIRLCSSEFPDEQTKIVWAMSYMKSGRAQKWAARVFRWEQQPEHLDQTKFLDWEDFVGTFKTEFTPAHSDALAINRLESTAYYQRGRPLDEYIDEFQDLIADSGYSDPKTVVVKFRRGLSAQIQNSVATMASGRPSDASPDAWYAMARVVDQNRAANEAFTSSSSSYRAPPPTSRPAPIPSIRPTMSMAKPVHAHLHPSPGNPIPMDLDATRNASVVPKCFRCKLPGHFGNNCPTRHDVRMMTTEELEEVLQQRLIRLDTPLPVQALESESEPEIREDFQPDSE
jgi:hypothetical protein